MSYVDRFSQNFLLARSSVSYFVMYTWHTLLHYPHGANAGCDLAGVAPVSQTTDNRTVQLLIQVSIKISKFRITELREALYESGELELSGFW